MVSRRGRKLRSDIVPKSRELGFFFSLNINSFFFLNIVCKSITAVAILT